MPGPRLAWGNVEVLSSWGWLEASAAAGKVVADSWTTAMLALWGGGLWVLQLVFRVFDALLTPDLSEHGAGRDAYQVTFWFAGALLGVLVMIQIGVVLVRRDGKSLVVLLTGLAQFVVVWAGWVVYAVAVVAACGGITRALMRTLLKVDALAAWHPLAPFEVADVGQTGLATVLGLMGLVLFLTAIGHLCVMITRAGALIVLVAMTPTSAAGLVTEAGGGRTWFWKSFRWFHAASLTPVVMVLLLGVGVQFTNGVALGGTEKLNEAVGTAVVGVVLILISSFCPLALFKLLAFTDPNTASGAALRRGLDVAGGLRGLVGGTAPLSGTGDDSGGAAGAVGVDGRASGEAASETATSERFTAAETGMLRTVGGAAGQLAARALAVMQTVGTGAASVGADLTNQMGVGHPTYHPDFSGGGDNGSSRTRAAGDSGQPAGPANVDSPDPAPASGGDLPDPLAPATPAPAPSPAQSYGVDGAGDPPASAGPGLRGASAAAGVAPPPVSGAAGSGAGSAGAAAEAAAIVPVVPV